ncbi:response regulator transcription factor [Flavobacterium sp.]|uniref:response regulator transcription factor n=1 Tax=Flavobacterium sp. TaxID=239 RepID=UPI00286D7BDB|nr:response regulator transcription factor [Flavobacterium sp.]
MNKKILVVEDESLIALDIKFILEKEGYEVITNIKTVETAIVCIEENNPALVLIDINLNQNKDGVDLGSYLLAKDTIPYIYITSYSNKVVLDRVNDTRPHGYIVKPFRSENLITTISVVLNNYKHKNIDTLRTENPTQEVVPSKVRSIVEYINANIDKKLEVEQLLAVTSWTKRHLTRIFMQYLKTSPYQYILNRKIEKACSLLKETDIPINEIAFDLGFQNYSCFCTAFKKINEDSPENYRKKNYVA